MRGPPASVFSPLLLLELLVGVPPVLSLGDSLVRTLEVLPQGPGYHPWSGNYDPMSHVACTTKSKKTVFCLVA